MRPIRRLPAAFSLVLLCASCSLIECDGDEGSEADRKLRDAIRDGDTEEARRQLEAGASADAASDWSISPRSIVRGEPGDWLGSYLKYHQLLWVRLYETNRVMCPPPEEQDEPRAQPESVGEVAEEVGSIVRDEAERVARSFENVTPLHTAAFFCRAEIATLLLEHGAQVNAADGAGLTPLHWVSCGEVAEILIEHDANVSAASASGLTPLHTAIDVDVVRVLLAHGARLDARDRCGNTPLHFASLMGLRFEQSDRPLEGGGDAAEMPAWARLLLALIEETAEVARLLTERFDVVGAMIDAGADVSATNESGSTPQQVLDSASSGGDDWD